MASYISAKKKENVVGKCCSCDSNKNIVSWIRDEYGKLQNFCKDCFEEATGKRVSKR